MAITIFSQPKKRPPFVLDATDEAILQAVGRYHFLTAEQLRRLLETSLRYGQVRLKRLADAEYLHRLFLPRPTRTGSAPILFTLLQKGRRHLTALDIELPTRFRPSEQVEHSYLFLKHTLAVNDVLIAAERFARAFPEDVALEAMHHERDLKRRPVKVAVTTGGKTERVGVIPDGWLDIALPKRRRRRGLVLEVDRGTSKQRKWRAKTAALLAFATPDAAGGSPYERAYGRRAITIIVTTPSAKRRDELLRWTAAELRERKAEAEASLFLFTSAPPAMTDGDTTFFTAPAWYQLFSSQPMPLLLPGKEAQ